MKPILQLADYQQNREFLYFCEEEVHDISEVTEVSMGISIVARIWGSQLKAL